MLSAAAAADSKGDEGTAMSFGREVEPMFLRDETTRGHRRSFRKKTV
jgi:hypothetical protein